MEIKLREALALSDGDVSGLFNEPLAVVVYAIIAFVLIAPPVWRLLRGDRESDHTPEELVSS